MVVHIVSSAILCLNALPPSTLGAVLIDTKGPGQLFLVNMAEYKKVFRLQPG